MTSHLACLFRIEELITGGVFVCMADLLLQRFKRFTSGARPADDQRRKISYFNTERQRPVHLCLDDNYMHLIMHDTIFHHMLFELYCIFVSCVFDVNFSLT